MLRSRKEVEYILPLPTLTRSAKITRFIFKLPSLSRMNKYGPTSLGRSPSQEALWDGGLGILRHPLGLPLTPRAAAQAGAGGGQPGGGEHCPSCSHCWAPLLAKATTVDPAAWAAQR